MYVCTYRICTYMLLEGLKLTRENLEEEIWRSRDGLIDRSIDRKSTTTYYNMALSSATVKSVCAVPGDRNSGTTPCGLG